MLDAGRVVDMAQNLMVESGLQLAAALVEEFKLMGREAVEVVAVGADKVREHRARDDRILMLQSVDELVHILFRVEAEAVHARIELDVHRPGSDAFLLSGLDEGVEQTEGVHLWLKVEVKHRLKRRHLGVHNHDVARDAVAAQCSTLIGHSHSEVVDAVVLQRLCNLNAAGSIGVGLNHTNELGLGLHKRTVVVEVGHDGIEVDLKHRLVHLFNQQFGNLVETELACALDEHHLVAHRAEHLTAEEGVDGGEEELLTHLDGVGIGGELRTDADELLHATLLAQLAHLTVKHRRHLTALLDVAQHNGAATTLVVGSAAHKVERDVEGVDVRVVGVVDERATMTAFLHLQTHGDRLKVHHALIEHITLDAQREGYGGADDGVLNAGVVDEGNAEPAFLTTFINIGNGCSRFLLFY